MDLLLFSSLYKFHRKNNPILENLQRLGYSNRAVNFAYHKNFNLKVFTRNEIKQILPA